MGINKRKKRLLCDYNDYKCEECKDGKTLSLEELEIHRNKPGDEGGTYEHRNCKIVCKKHHEILNSAQRMARGISK